MNAICKRHGLLPIATLGLVGIILLMVTSPARPSSPSGIIFVDASASAGGYGSNWATAMNSLDAAIAAASPGDALWVKAGTYPAPSAAGDGFVITKHLLLYGGFDGSEGTLDTRAGQFSSTILDGGSNTRVVTVSGVTGSPGVLIDGFQLKEGVGSGGSYGGAFNGAGIYSTGSDLTLANCLFYHDYSGHDGGGVYFTGALGAPNALNLKLCEFQEDRAENNGGAIYGAFLASGDVVNTLFNTNHTISGNGGAVYLEDMGSSNQLWFTNCVFWRNYVAANGATGGGLDLGESGTTSATASNAMIVNCTFVGNSSPGPNDGQALHVSSLSLCQLHNSILYFNGFGSGASAVPFSGAALVARTFCDVENTTPALTNISSDPYFRSISYPGGLTLRGPTTSPFFVGSDCIDRADYNKLPNDNLDVNLDGITTTQTMPYDMNGLSRANDWGPTSPNHGIPTGLDYLDMGAYEKQ